MIRFRHKTFLSDSKEEEGTCALFVEPSSGLASGVLVIPILRSKDRSEGAIPQIPALSTFKDDVIGFSVKRPALWRLRWESQAAATAVVQENLKILRASERRSTPAADDWTTAGVSTW